MRAARILDMLLILQHRGRLSARQLAEALEVSQRTVLRDVEALSEAGVPIYATRGAGGGIDLLDGFRTQLTGLTDEEAGCLFLAGQPLVAGSLGLAGPAARARHKLLNAMAPGMAARAEALTGWFLHDPESGGGSRVPASQLHRLGRSVVQHRWVEITLGDGAGLQVRPLGLVLKAGSWHLVVAGTRGPVPLCHDGRSGPRVTGRRFDPPAGFELAAFWAARH